MQGEKELNAKYVKRKRGAATKQKIYGEKPKDQQAEHGGDGKQPVRKQHSARALKAGAAAQKTPQQTPTVKAVNGEHIPNGEIERKGKQLRIERLKKGSGTRVCRKQGGEDKKGIPKKISERAAKRDARLCLVGGKDVVARLQAKPRVAQCQAVKRNAAQGGGEQMPKSVQQNGDQHTSERKHGSLRSFFDKNNVCKGNLFL